MYIELMWLTERLAPECRTIADFHRDNGATIRAVCDSLSSFAVGSSCSRVPLLRSTAANARR
jgi:hypothetical protein